MMTDEQIIAMAVAAIAEESGTDLRHIRVVSFREMEKSNLEKYIEENAISYSKYRLGE